MKRMCAGLLAVGLIQSLATVAFADGDVAKGAIVFKKCTACHVADKPANKLGPHMVGIVGRAVASVEGFKYSDAMKAHAATVPVWDEAALAIYLENPKAVVPKTKMAFPGVKTPEERADLIAYLKTLK